MSTAGTIKLRHQTVIANNPAYDVSALVINDSLVIASAANDGSLFVKDSGNADGWGLLPSVAVGSVLVPGGVGVAPLWSASPTVTSVLITGSGNFIDKSGTSTRIVGNGVGFAVGGSGLSTWNIPTDSSLAPINDNAQDLGASNPRLRTGYFGTALVVGATPATVGFLRGPNNDAMYMRNAANSADRLVVGMNNLDQALFGDNGNNKASIIYGSIVPFGGTTASFPALKRNTTNIEIRVADDSGQSGLIADNVQLASFIQVGSQVATTGSYRAATGFTIKARNAGNSADGTIVSTDAQDKTGLGGQSISVVNNAVISLGATLNGFLVVQTINYSGLLAPRGAVHAVTIVSDPTGSFSVVAATAGLVNVYWSAGNSRYELENKTGVTIAVTLLVLGVN